jgi:hypothetical protein
MGMADDADLHALLEPVLAVVRTIDPASATAAEDLAARLPIDGPILSALRRALRAAIDARSVADRENDGVRYSRLRKATGEGEISVDVVHMSKAALAHTHPRGEIDLCFAVSGTPRFDARPEGWSVYPPGSWHVPTVDGGAMDILYFLPGGAIRFESAQT